VKPTIKITHPQTSLVEIEFVPALPSWNFVGNNRDQFIHIINAVIGKLYLFELLTPMVMDMIEKEVEIIVSSWIDNGSIIIPESQNITSLTQNYIF